MGERGVSLGSSGRYADMADDGAGWFLSPYFTPRAATSMLQFLLKRVLFHAT